MTKLTASEYREMMAKRNPLNVPETTTGRKSKPVKEKLSTKEALRAMGEYFEWDKKSVDFVIKQWELTGII
jgi:hypothetical protein